MKIIHIYSADIRKSMRMLAQCRAVIDSNSVEVVVIGESFGSLLDWDGISIRYFDDSQYWDPQQPSKGRLMRGLQHLLASAALVKKSWFSNGVYHFHQHNTLISASIFAVLGRGRIVYDPHDMDLHDDSKSYYHTKLSKIRRALERFVVWRASSLISVSEAMQAVYERAYPKANHCTIYSIPPYSEVDKRREVVERVKKPIKMVYWGNIAEDRIPSEFIKQVNNQPEFNFEIYGRVAAHNTSSFEEATEKLKAYSGNVSYHGEFIPSQINGILEDQDIACFSFCSDRMNIACAMPNKLWQAMENNLPILVFDGESLRGFVEKYGVGEVINWQPTMAETMIEVEAAMKKIMSNYELYQKSIVNVKETVMDRGNFEKLLWDSYGVVWSRQTDKQ